MNSEDLWRAKDSAGTSHRVQTVDTEPPRYVLRTRYLIVVNGRCGTCRGGLIVDNGGSTIESRICAPDSYQNMERGEKKNENGGKLLIFQNAKIKDERGETPEPC